MCSTEYAEAKNRQLSTSGKAEYTWLIEPKYKDASLFRDGRWPVKKDKDGLWGYVDSADNVVIDFQYLEARFFANSVALVTVSGNLTGAIDVNGKYLIQPRADLYQWRDPSEEGLIAFGSRKDGCGFLNLSDDIQISAVYTHVSRFDNGMAYVGSGDRWGVIDWKGREVIPLSGRYKLLGNFWKGYIPFKADTGLWGVINLEEQVVLEPLYTHITGGSDAALLRVELDGKIGFMDETFKFVVEPRYQTGKPMPPYADYYKYELVYVFDSDSKNYLALDEEGNVAFEFFWVTAQPSRWDADGKYVLMWKPFAGTPFQHVLVNKKGEMLLLPEFSVIMPSDEGPIAVQQQDGLWGLLILEQEGEE